MKELIAAARAAREHAYAPYSQFAVGAAVLTSSGTIYTGANVENASYGLSNCAERSALFAAVTAGVRPGEVVALAVIAATPGPVAPCGACRQVMSELLAPAAEIYLANLAGAVRKTTLAELLPDGFKGSDLDG